MTLIFLNMVLGYVVPISSFKSLCRNVSFAFIRSISKLKDASTYSMNLTNVHIVTREKISPNSIPSTLEYPFATNLSLLFSTFPSNPNFIYECPFASHGFLSIRKWDQVPRFILYKCNHFLIHIQYLGLFVFHVHFLFHNSRLNNVKR
jgi:hypothetical protein